MTRQISLPLPALVGRRVRLWGRVLAVLLLGFVTVEARVASGQAPAPSTTPTERRITQYVHEAWQVEDGLPQNSVYTALQTRDGYLWLGTQQGLVRFDGARFTVFDKARVDELKSNEIRALYEDREGALWIGTNGGGVTRLYDGSFTTYTSEDGLSSDLVRALYQSRDGALWIGTIDGGLNRFDGGAFTSYTTEQGLAGAVVLAIREDHAGALWVGTEAGLSRLHEGAFTGYTTEEGLPGDLVWALHVDGDGALWVGATGGLARFDDDGFASYTTQDGLCGNVVSAFHQDPEGALWIGTLDGGLCRLRNERFDAFTEHEGLTNNRIRTLHRDREANLWIGTEGGGLNRLRAGKFIPITPTEGLSGTVVFTVLEDRRGTVWIGTEGGGLNRLDAAGVTSFTTEDGLPSNDVYALHEDRRGALWIGLFEGGLCRRTAGRFTCFTTDDGLSSNSVYALHEDRRGILWIGTEAGLNRLADDQITAYAPEAGVLHDVITAIHEDRHGALWIGSYDGLSRLRDDQVTTYSTEQGLSSPLVLTLYEDRRGSLWIGTQEGGLCRLRDERLACITTREGLFDDTVFQILEDEAGALWLSSNKGIARVDRRALDDVADGRREAVVSLRYDKADGLPSSETSGGTQPPAWHSRDGRLWFSTSRGVAVIDPSNIPTNPVPPPVVLETISVNGTPTAPAEAAALAPGSKDLIFHYAGLSFVAPERVGFQYKLEGYDEAWVEAGTRRDAYYTNLPPGAYRFRVKAHNDDGVWNESGAAFSFYHAPYFYQTRWFYALCLLALLGLGFTGYRLRINQLKRRERDLERLVEARTRDLRLEKEKTEKAKGVIEAQANKLRELDRFKTRFFANLSHEFRTPLTMIVGPLENALVGSYGPLEHPLRRQVEIMLRNALRLMRLINQLLDLSKLEAGKMQLRARPRDVVSFLEGIVLSCMAFAEHKGLSLETDFERGALDLYFEPDKLEKVFYNLLSNAMKFTPPGGRIAVTLSEKAPTPACPEGFIEVQVRDSGQGIAPEHLPYIFDRFQQVEGANTREHEGTGIGLALVKELILLHHGTISVESDVGTGTTFTLSLPLGKAHLQHDEFALDLLEDDTPAPQDSAMIELAAAAFDFINTEQPPASTSAPAARPRRSESLILVVDDNADVLEYIRTTLETHYRVATACDGKAGLEQARALLPDLIISDVMMPKMDGDTLCQSIKADPHLNHIPVILLTARATHLGKLSSLEAGADDYMAKPFNARELRTRTQNLLTLRRQEKELKILNEHLEQQVREQVDQILAERERYEAALIVAKEKAEASSLLKSAILNNMSHELRTPITSILGYSQVLVSEVTEEHREFTTYIEQNAHRLLETLSAILDLASLESDTFEPRPALFDLAEAVREAASLHQPPARQKALDLRLKLPARAVAVCLDRTALIRILDLLIGNAVKYTEAGAVLVEADAHHDRLTVKVRDTGIGISEAFMPHLFEAFKQESTGLAREHEGNGLGLAITRRLVDALHGSITVTSEKGAGSLFTVSLPQAPRPSTGASLPERDTSTAR